MKKGFGKLMTAIVAVVIMCAGSTVVKAGDQPKDTKISSIEVKGHADVYIVQGDSSSIKVEENEVNPSVDLKDGKLVISSYARKKVIIWVYVTSVPKVEVEGAVNVYAIDKMKMMDANSVAMVK